MSRNTNYIQLALELQRAPWLIYGAEEFLPIVRRFLEGGAAAASAIPEDGPRVVHLTVEGSSEPRMAAGRGSGSARKDPYASIIPVHGPITKYDTCESYGTTTLAAHMAQDAADPLCVGFILDIDSPGGSPAGVAAFLPTLREVRAAGKPVLVHCDSCYSAAYWIASQCDGIFADNELSSGVGSIGAYAELVARGENTLTGEKIVSIYAPQSTEKNLAYREALEGRPERYAEELRKLVDMFQADVLAGRPRLDKSDTHILAGATFTPSEAVKNGLADGIATLAEVAQNLFARLSL